MKSSTHSKLLLTGLLLLCGCQNLPQSGIEPTAAVLWDLDSMLPTALPSEAAPQTFTSPVRDDQPAFVPAVDFETAFAQAVPYAGNAPAPTAFSAAADAPSERGQDAAEWQFFAPAEFGNEPLDDLIVRFKNTGDSGWNKDYSLVWYAGENPSAESRIPLGESIAPGEDIGWQIPIKSNAASWKSCWQLRNDADIAFYEFCYNHGDGSTSAPAVQASASGGSSADNSGVYFAFAKISGSAPAAESGVAYRSSGVSLNPGDGHTFCAYDHTENLQATFTNTGEAAWDSSVSLRFYSDYNWMHTDVFPVTGSVAPGESYTFTMPMEIIEDNDHWSTCWYLAAPDGGSMSSFCFVYYTRSC